MQLGLLGKHLLLQMNTKRNNKSNEMLLTSGKNRSGVVTGFASSEWTENNGSADFIKQLIHITQPSTLRHSRFSHRYGMGHQAVQEVLNMGTINYHRICIVFICKI